MTIYRTNAALPAAAGRAGFAAAGRVGLVVRELPDSGAVLRLTRGRAWIAVLCALLAGIVALNVVSLGLTAGSGQTGQQIELLQRENSALRSDLAEKLSASRIQAAAPSLGLSVPPAVDITYLDFKPSDLTRAAKVLAGEISAAAEPWAPSGEEAGDPASAAVVAETTSESAAAGEPSSSAPPSPSPAVETAAPTPTAPSAGAASSGGGVSAGL